MKKNIIVMITGIVLLLSVFVIAQQIGNNNIELTQRQYLALSERNLLEYETENRIIGNYIEKCMIKNINRTGNHPLTGENITFEKEIMNICTKIPFRERVCTDLQITNDTVQHPIEDENGTIIGYETHYLGTTEECLAYGYENYDTVRVRNALNEWEENTIRRIANLHIERPTRERPPINDSGTTTITQR